MKRIFTPLTWEQNESKAVVLDRLRAIDQADLISGIEINLPAFFALFGEQQAEIPNLIQSIGKPILGICGLESKGDTLPQSEKIAIFQKAIMSGVPLVDLERTANFPEYVANALTAFTQTDPDFDPAQRLVTEYASFTQTPDFAEACKILEEMAAVKPFLIKFITMVNKPAENEVFYRLLDKYAKSMNLIAFGMGEAGLESRISSVRRGGYATYGHFGLAAQACPGQIYYQDLAARI